MPRESIKADTSARKTIESLVDHFDQMSGLGDCASPLGDFAYPYHRKPTRQNIELMRKAEAKIDAFWAHVDAEFFKSDKTANTTQRPRGFAVNPRALQRTLPWWEPNPQSSGSQKSPVATELTANVEYKPSWSIPTDGTAPARAEQTSKAKRKTTGAADPAKEPHSSKATSSEQPTTRPSQIFNLHQRAYKIVTALFPTAIHDRQIGKISWQDFVYTMYRLEFKIRKHDGSEWNFEPRWKPEVPIMVQEPHGGSDEIPPHKLRFHARRLVDRYGWTGETFVPAWGWE